MAILEGADPRERLRAAYANALTKNWMLWPAVQAVNFKVVPLEHRVLVVNVVSLGEISAFFCLSFFPSFFLIVLACCFWRPRGGGDDDDGALSNGGFYVLPRLIFLICDTF